MLGESLLAALITLWTIDVGVNLAGSELPWAGNGAVQVTPLDYLGLLVGELQVAALLLLASLAAAAIVALISPRARSAGTWVALLSGLTTALIVFGQSYILWSSSSIAFPVRCVFGGVAGIGIAAAVRALAGERGGELLPAGLLYPAIVCATANVALLAIRRGDIAGFATSALTAVVATGLAWWSLRGSPRRLRIAGWLPVGVTCLLALAAVSAASSYGAPDGPAREHEGARRPDIVLIVLDTVRADHLRSHGYGRDTMPLFGAWADDATLFERAVSPAGWTRPSHASLFSGEPVSIHGVHYSTDATRLNTAAREGVSWLPERLAGHGYTSVAVAANPLAIPRGGIGFDRLLLPGRNGWHLGTIAGLADDNSPLLQRINERLGWRMPYAVARTTVETVMRALPAAPSPLFLFVNLMDAHAPYNPPRAALADLGLDPGHPFSRYEFGGRLTERWDSLPAGADAVLADLYDGELRGMDAQLGRLLAWIDRTLGEDTVVVVTSDHGEELGEQGRVGHEWGLPQRVIHVPLVIRAPSWPAGTVADIVTIRSLDPFIEALARGEQPGIDRIAHPDAFGVVAERYPSRVNADRLGDAYFRPWVTMFAGSLKVTGPADQGMAMADIEVRGFDFAQPVFDPEAGKELAQKVSEYWRKHRDAREAEGEEPSMSEEELRRLRALGYIR
jgi:hypothetical protein